MFQVFRVRVQGLDPGSRVGVQGPGPWSGSRVRVQGPGRESRVRGPDPETGSRVRVQVIQVAQR